MTPANREACWPAAPRPCCSRPSWTSSPDGWRPRPTPDRCSAGDLSSRLATLASERGELYAEVADVRVDAGALGPDEVVDRIVEALA